MVIGIDPGPVESAYVVWDGEKILELGHMLNESLICEVFPRVRREYPGIDMVVERITSYGMAVGQTVFETVFWTGQFCRAWAGTCPDCYQGIGSRVERMKVKMHLCHDSRAKDSNIRQSLIDMYEPDLKPKCRPKGVLKGVSKDCWQALAVAVYYHDNQNGIESMR